MEKVILIRFGEMFLKGRNKNYFEKIMVRNIKSALQGFAYEFGRAQNRYFIEKYAESDERALISALKKVFGLHSLSVAQKIETDYGKLAEAAVAALDPDARTFRVTVNRADKTLDLNGTQIGAMLGGKVLEAYPRLKVDLHKPQCEIKVDIRENGFSYVFSAAEACAQGMPVGTGGKGLLLLSGGFDSPVAGWRMARRGMEIAAIHFHSYPHTGPQAKQKVVDLAKILSAYCGEMTLCCVRFTDIQEAIHRCCNPDFMITVMRRIMVRIAERIAEKNGCGALITGESLAQVASQTLQSISVTDDAAEKFPIFRPLIGMDKSEIMQTAAEIGTFEVSELPYEDCCTVFLPKNPVIRPALAVARAQEERVENLSALIDACVENAEILKIAPKGRVKTLEK